MARVNQPVATYRVEFTEYERGWGQREMGEKFFDNENEAKQFCINYAGGDYECFYRADYKKVS